YDAVVFATGAPHDRPLGIPGEDLANVFGSAAFVGWYNGHPQFANLDLDLSGKSAAVIGMGNVALDVARILSKTRAEFAGSDIVAHALDALDQSAIATVTIIGRRGPHQIMMTPKELGELMHLDRATPRVDPADLPEPAEDAILEPGLRKSVAHLRSFAAIPESERADKAIEIDFDMFASPVRLVGEGKVTGVEVERTRVEAGRAVGTGETYVIPADLVVACIGYRSSPIAGVPFDERAGKFANDDGRILPGLYCVGWAKRGPTGTIGTNRPDGFGVVERIAEDMASGALGSASKQGRAGFDTLAEARGLDVVTFRDWKKIEEAEAKAAREGAPREKFVDIESMIRARG
ncbi:MAG: FAD-dependent oxidoreductase, partial [Tsuneonella sp.]